MDRRRSSLRREPPRRATLRPAEAAGPGGPEKIYFKIGEAARLLGLPAYVLRYWETEFPELRPRKSGTGRRIYSRADIEMLRMLRRLLHEERFTIEGARRHLASLQASRPARETAAAGNGDASPPGDPVDSAGAFRSALRRLRGELSDLARLLSDPPRRVS